MSHCGDQRDLFTLPRVTNAIESETCIVEDRLAEFINVAVCHVPEVGYEGRAKSMSAVALAEMMRSYHPASM